jgi:hypothetical protein
MAKSDEGMTSFSEQLFSLFILALPVASIAWTVTHEEILRELREMCETRSQVCRRLALRKFFYVFTCEYCFSHYVSILVLILTGYRLLWPDWRGFAVALFALVWVANLYMALYGRLRLDIKHERVDIAADEKALEESKRPARPREVSAGPRR